MVTGAPQQPEAPESPGATAPGGAPPAGASGAGRRLPPVTQWAVAALILVVAGGVGLAARLPEPPPLAPAIAALAAAALALAAAGAALTRAREFAWHTFRVVGGWTLAAYAVIAGMLEFVFVLDRTPGPVLTVLSLMLLVYAVDIPLIVAFSVARYQPATRG